MRTGYAACRQVCLGLRWVQLLLKLDPQLAPDRLAVELANAAQGMTGADIAYVCQRAAMFCVKDAVGGAAELTDIAITRRHFDVALSHLATTHSTEAMLEPRHLLLAG